MNSSRVALAGVAGGILTIVGAIGAWATFQDQSFAGTDANRGKTVAIAAGIGLLLLALAAFRPWLWAALLAAVAGVISAALTIWSLIDINNFSALPPNVPLGRGWGIWLATIGSVALVAAALLVAARPSPPPAEAAPPPPPPAT